VEPRTSTKNSPRQPRPGPSAGPGLSFGATTALDPLGKKGGDKDWYGYCVDDPVNRVDACGLKTFNFGGNVSGSAFGIGGAASTSVDRDGEGNWSWENTVGVGPAAGLGVSGGLFGQYTNATRMDELAGKGQQAGWSVGDIPVEGFKFGKTFGIDQVTGKDYTGTSAQIGIGAGTPDVHVYETNTWSKDLPMPDFQRDAQPDDFDLYYRD